MSLPYLLGLKGSKVFAYSEGYLGANEALAKEYKEKYFNNDKFSSKGYNIYDFEFYIAFILFVNLLKINDIEKIKNLTNNDIEKLQQNYIYNAENLSSVRE